MDIKAAYKQLKEDHPEAYTALAVLPYSGQLTAIADYAEAMSDGDPEKMALAAGSMIPGVKLAKMGKTVMAVKVSPPSLRVGMNSAEKALAPVIKHSPEVGKGFAAEQVGGYGRDKAERSGKPVDHVANDVAEYTAAWNAHP